MNMMKGNHWMLGNMRWAIWDGNKVEVGLDAIKGLEGNHSLSASLITLLHEKGIYKIAHIVVKNNHFSAHPTWLRAIDICLIEKMTIKWEAYITNLDATGTFIGEDEYRLQWEGPAKYGFPKVKEIYDNLPLIEKSFNPITWYREAWGWEIPMKLQCFGWLAIHKIIFTWDNLQGRGFQGLVISSMSRMHVRRLIIFSWDVRSLGKYGLG